MDIYKLLLKTADRTASDIYKQKLFDYMNSGSTMTSLLISDTH
eukprot:CAMPEP_0116902766 /NCGR_PEP_ID=MMETSP0467-20121206/10270_1 /TAXON_ID=283647 /ORGANISM="Mesodinium pulex, Strain SPMC105" /LENGTH=42 /DNA_ID= /DNA_START= /DNA_END= /DNA_ORIENTATION=